MKENFQKIKITHKHHHKVFGIFHYFPNDFDSPNLILLAIVNM